MKKRDAYPIACDCVVFGYHAGDLKIALIERGKPPFMGDWALPGGFAEGDETMEEAAARELREETSMDQLYLRQLGIYSQPNRDPRGRVISSAFIALVDFSLYPLVGSEDAAQAKWWPLTELPALAFDHAQIVTDALAQLRLWMRVEPLAFKLLPEYFTLSQLQQLLESLLARSLDKRNFRKKMARYPFVQATDRMQSGGRHRPARLYRFDPQAFVADPDDWWLQ